MRLVVTTAIPCKEHRGVVAKNILRGQAFSNYDVIRAMTSLLQLFFQNIGGANCPPCHPIDYPLKEHTMTMWQRDEIDLDKK